jgi:NAD(P)H-hydrate repair Nnr-like enzyme with NAD(P)H-hydrate dehydratase domain
MARLLSISPNEVQLNRITHARKFAETYKVHLILKGARTLVAGPDGHIYINLTGNSGMASAGMGDVLTGMVAGFISQGYPPKTAAQIAVYLHGEAADTLAESKGPFGYIASDVMDGLPEALNRLIKKKVLKNTQCRLKLHHLLL